MRIGGTAVWDLLDCRRRVISALLLREVISRFGRENFAFGWLILEPLLFVFPVLTMWSYIRVSEAHGIKMTAVSWTGYLPLMLYRHCGSTMIHSVSTNGAIFYHRPISILDFFLARIGVEVLSNLAAVIFSLVILSVVAGMETPRDWPTFMLGYFYMIWWCASVALIVGAYSEYTVWVEKIWMPAGYMYIAVSGCFYLADWLPPSVRYWALCQPSLQAYEMIRAGMFGPAARTYADYLYTPEVLAVLTLLGLWGIYNVRSRIQAG